MKTSILPILSVSLLLHHSNSQETADYENYFPVPSQFRKVAFLVGVNEYNEAKPLNNPTNDVRTLERILTNGGFNVTVSIDPTKNDFESGFRSFLDDIPRSRLAFFFFAGHGVESKGRNFLIPTDGGMDRDGSLDERNIGLDAILESVSRSKARASVIVLDCCRNDPFSNGSAKPGLADVDQKRLADGMLVAFSAAPGKTVSDGPAGGNSPFVARLERELRPGRSAIQTFVNFAYSQHGDKNPWIRFRSTEPRGLARIALVPLIGPKTMPSRRPLSTFEGLRNDLYKGLQHVHRTENNERHYAFEKFKREAVFFEAAANAYFGASHFGGDGAEHYFGNEFKAIEDGIEEQERLVNLKDSAEFAPGTWVTNLAAMGFSDFMSEATEEFICEFGQNFVETEAFGTWIRENRIGRYWED